MIEEKISRLISVEKGSVPVSFRAPQILLDKVRESDRKKVGAVKERGLTTDALIYFAARGVASASSATPPNRVSDEESTF